VAQLGVALPGELEVCGTFSGTGERGASLLRLVAPEFSNGFELAEGLSVTWAVQGLFGLDQGVEGLGLMIVKCKAARFTACPREGGGFTHDASRGEVVSPSGASRRY